MSLIDIYSHVKRLTFKPLNLSNIDALVEKETLRPRLASFERCCARVFYSWKYDKAPLSASENHSFTPLPCSNIKWSPLRRQTHNNMSIYPNK